MTVGFILGVQIWFNICKSINGIQHIKRIENKKNHLNRCRKIFGQNSTSLHNKSPEEPRNRRLISPIINVVYVKSIANIMLNMENLKAFLLKMKNKTWGV
jgi:hypothetical protein